MLERKNLVENLLQQGTSAVCSTPIGRPLLLAVATRDSAIVGLVLGFIERVDPHATSDVYVELTHAAISVLSVMSMPGYANYSTKSSKDQDLFSISRFEYLQFIYFLPL
jgi:hypothetical protein